MLKNVVWAGLVAVGLSACAAPSANLNVSAPQGATAYQAVESFTRTLGTAEAIATVCARQGIKRSYSDSRTVSRDYVNTLIRQGYSAESLAAATEQLDRKKSLAQSVKYLESRGARKGDAKSLCAVGRNEIAQGTAVGKLLRLG